MPSATSPAITNAAPARKSGAFTRAGLSEAGNATRRLRGCMATHRLISRLFRGVFIPTFAASRRSLWHRLVPMAMPLADLRWESRLRRCMRWLRCVHCGMIRYIKENLTDTINLFWLRLLEGTHRNVCVTWVVNTCCLVHQWVIFWDGNRERRGNNFISAIYIPCEWKYLFISLFR